MKLAPLHLAICLGALVGLYAIQLGWRPAFVTIWDMRSKLYLDALFGGLAFLSPMGVAPEPTKPEASRWGELPRTILVMTLWALIMGAVEVNAGDPRSEVLRVVTIWAAGGAGVGLLLGFAASFEANAPKPSATLNGWRAEAMLIALYAGVVVVMGFLLVQHRPEDNGTRREYVNLETQGYDLTVFVWAAPITDDEFGTLRIRNATLSDALVLDPEEWPELQRLWTQARKSQGPTWRRVGEMHDTGPGEISRLTLDAGPGVRLTLQSDRGDPIRFEVKPVDLQKVDDALVQAGKDLDTDHH